MAFYQAQGAPASQQFHTQSYHTHSVYPTYNVQHQTFPLNSILHSVFVPNSFGFNSANLNSSEFKKFEIDIQGNLEKFKNENNDQKVDGKSVVPFNPGSIVHVPFSTGKAVSDADHSKGGDVHELTSFGHHQADPIFGPEIGSKYDIHYSPEHLVSLPAFSNYPGYPDVHAAFPAQPVFPTTYDFSTYPEYPHYVGFASAAAGPPSLDVNKIVGIQSNPPILGSFDGRIPSR